MLDPARPPADGALRRHVADHLAEYAVPRWVHVLTELPRGATGKTDKTALRQEAASRAGR